MNDGLCRFSPVYGVCLYNEEKRKHEAWKEFAQQYYRSWKLLFRMHLDLEAEYDSDVCRACRLQTQDERQRRDPGLVLPMEHEVLRRLQAVTQPAKD